MVEIAREAAALGCCVEQNVPLSRLTSFRVGGPADYMITAPETAVSALLKKLKEERVPVLILGNGSNLLVSDRGFRGVVLKIAPPKEPVLRKGDELYTGAGLSLKQLCLTAQREGLSGLEPLYGIPGTVGGAVFMNAGAYSGTFADIVAETVYVDADGNIRSVKGEEHDFGYRHSCFTPDDVICETKLVLRRGNKDEIRAEMQSLIEKRKASQPLEYPSAGSFFKRPTGYFAGKLIQDSGLKGVSVGGARVSEKHAGFIINTGDATCRDVDGLRELVQKTVYEKFGVMLEPEVKRIK